MAIILAYGCFGGIMGSFPSLSSEVFGLRYTGQIMESSCQDHHRNDHLAGHIGKITDP